MLLARIKGRLSRLRATIRATFLGPSDWDEQSYLAFNLDVKEAVERGELRSGLEHWHRGGRLEGRKRSAGDGRGTLKHSDVPQWLKTEMLAISTIEPKIFPSKAFWAAAKEHRPMEDNNAGYLYSQLLEEIEAKTFTHVFLLSSLRAGGVELECLRHIQTLASNFGSRILVILTENTDSPWLYRLSQSVTPLDFGKKRNKVDQSTAEIVLARLLLKLKAPVIHNANSAIGWQLFCRYGAALCSESKLYASLPCFEYTNEGEPFGYARQLEKAHPYLERVFCDNHSFPAMLGEMYGIRADLFVVMAYPVSVAPRFKYTADRRPKILWASRLDRQKRPDILQKIAQSVPECMFHVYGSGPSDRGADTRKTCDALRKLSNVVMFGAYDGFDAIPTDNYAVFLYTAQWDGMPNVILEGLASGLAVLAPNVGGISEVIPPNSGFLVPQFDNIQAYVEAVRRMTANPRLILEERDRALRLLREKYSSDAFAASLARLPSYTQSGRLPMSSSRTLKGIEKFESGSGGQNLIIGKLDRGRC